MKRDGAWEPKTGIAPLIRLLEQVMCQESCRSAPRVFLIVDNGSSHRGRKAAQRLQGLFPNLILVHTPTQESGPRVLSGSYDHEVPRVQQTCLCRYSSVGSPAYSDLTS